MCNKKYSDMTDQELVALEESMYDAEVGGYGNWFERDQVLWEMNRRGFGKSREQL